MSKIIIVASVFLCAFSLCGAAENVEADIVLMDGDVYTMEPDQPWAKAVVITGNKITKVLDNAAHAKKCIGPNTQVYSLKGKLVLPGFIDCHMHFNFVSNRFGKGLAGDREALKRFAQYGIVEIHDMTIPEQTKAYIALEEKGELTCRVWLRANLSRSTELADKGFRPGLHPKTKKPSSMLRYGGMKGFMDGLMGTFGALFFEKYDNKDTYGVYRDHSKSNGKPDMEKFYQLVRTAYKAGFPVDCHAIGTKGNHLVLEAYERLQKEEVVADLSKFRMVHGQVVRPQDFKRFAKLGIIMEGNPNHVLLDMKWMIPRIGYERCKGAYAFKTFLDNGVPLCFGSDWSGSPAEDYQPHPKYLLHGAVNRQKVDGTPKEGWYPEQRLTMHEALRAYTLAGAEATFEGDIRGSIKERKLADITVVDRNLLNIDPTTLLNMKINMTIVDGRVVYSEL